MKQQLRNELLRARRAMGPDARSAASLAIRETLLGLPRWREARAVGLFVSLPSEVDTAPLIREALVRGARVALPIAPGLGSALSFRWVEEGAPLQRSSFGVMEPAGDAPRASITELDLVVCPGLGFDRRGARLGYGGGYYDRTLVQGVPTVLLAFACQELDQVPEDPFDRRMDAVVTERGLLELG